MIITGGSCRPIWACVPLLRACGAGAQVDSRGGRSDGAGGERMSAAMDACAGVIGV